MKTKILFAVFLLVVVLSTTVPAQKPAAKKTAARKPPECADLETQAGMNRCALYKYQKADEALNKSYQETMNVVQPDLKPKLKAAQQAWIQFRDAHCECEAFIYEGGTIQPLIKYSCLETVTIARTKQLKALANDVH
ncbi:MAG: DUF1311 domain-containing protein [Acidobacteria bacterium]|nr:DUF1311 domain-containing protein [Acidobacteriota bacterium]